MARTAIVVSGVVRSIAEASSTWKFKGDYFLVGDEYTFKRRNLVPQKKLADELSLILKKTNVEFSSVLIPSMCSVALKNENYHNSVINMLWKWKCAYHLIQPYHTRNKYKKILIIRPDIYINYVESSNSIDNFEVEENTIHTMEDTHTLDVNGVEVTWMNDIFLLLDMSTYSKISKMYDFYVENYQDIIEKQYNIHTFFGEYLKKESIRVKGGLLKFLDFIILTDSSCETMFEDGQLKEGYTLIDLWKHIEKNSTL
jgi:hypothetical protein